MAEQKDVRSLSLARALEPQLLNSQWQEDTGTHQKRYPTSKDKGEAAMRQQEGCNHNKIKSHNRCVGDSQTEEQLYHRSPLIEVKALSPMSGFPTYLSIIQRRANTHPSQTLPKNCRGRNIPKLILRGQHHTDTKTRQTYYKKRKFSSDEFLC